MLPACLPACLPLHNVAAKHSGAPKLRCWAPLDEQQRDEAEKHELLLDLRHTVEKPDLAFLRKLHSAQRLCLDPFAVRP